jgi:hypothetical protein
MPHAATGKRLALHAFLQLLPASSSIPHLDHPEQNCDSDTDEDDDE